MVALALPFIWVGIVLTMKRLRGAGLPAQLVALFFIPFLNLLFFLVLCLLPEADGAPAEAKATPPRDSRLARLFPASALGSAAISLLLTVPLGFGAALLGAQVLTNYGSGLFVALPFTLGFASAVIYGMRHPRSLASCVWVAGLSTMLLGAALLALAFEGVICPLMEAPARPARFRWRMRVSRAEAPAVRYRGPGFTFRSC